MAKLGLEDTLGSQGSLDVKLSESDLPSKADSTPTRKKALSPLKNQVSKPAGPKTKKAKPDASHQAKEEQSEEEEEHEVDEDKDDTPGSPLAVDFDEEPAEELQKTQLAFQSNHPLLTALSNLPAEYYTVEDVAETETAPKKSASTAAPKKTQPAASAVAPPKAQQPVFKEVVNPVLFRYELLNE